MKLVIFFFFLVLIVACQPKTPIIEVPQHLEEALSKAEGIRFSHPEEVDSILCTSLIDIKSINSNELWARYYFLKAHVAVSESDFVLMAVLLDSALHCNLYADARYIDKVTLLEASANEELLLYEQALGYYNKLCARADECTLSANERLTVYLGKARIAMNLELPYSQYLDEARHLVEHNTDMNLGLYYSNVAYFEQANERNIHYNKLALAYFQNKRIPLKAFVIYSNLASSYINVDVDSALFYIEKAGRTITDNKLELIIEKSRNRVYYLYTYARILYKQGLYPQSKAYIEQAIPIARAKDFEDALQSLKRLKSEILFAQHKYHAFKRILEQAYNHYYAYNLRISENQIKYTEAKHHIDEVMRENEIFHLTQKSLKLSNRLFLLITILISFGLIFLVFRGRRIKDQLVMAYEKMHKKDVSIFELETKVSKVTKHADSTVYPEKTILSKINKEIKTTHSVSSWDSFYLIYTHQYPNYDKRLMTCFPQLKPKELQYVMCVHYGLSDEKTALLFEIQLPSVRKKRQRLRQVLGLMAEDDLQTFINFALTNCPYKVSNE